MADRNIVTQVGIEALKFALTEIAENLNAHVNASLSKAHGVNIVVGFVDSDGNDRTTYQDSNGDVIGNYFLRFAIENVIYFAPAVVTALPGQDATTGSVNTSPEDEFTGQGGSAWITDYTSTQVEQADAINDDVLIPHTRQPHASTHGSLTVLLQNTFTSLGHVAGTHVIQIRIANNVYNIPCVTRLGGPLQAPRLGGIASNLSVNIPEGAPNTCDVPVTAPLLGGTKPVAYHWQYNNVGVWTDITPAVSGNLPVSGWSGGVDFQWASTATPTFRIVGVHPGSNQTRSAQFRCRVTNVAVPDTGADSGVMTNVLTFSATDKTGTWLCGVAWEFGHITLDDYRVDAAWSAKNIGPVTYAGYSMWAAPLSRWFRAHPAAFPLIAPFVQAWTNEVGFRNGTKQRGSLLGKAVMAVGRPICCVLGAVKGYSLLFAKLSTARR
jgi:hypothetical protein